MRGALALKTWRDRREIVEDDSYVEANKAKANKWISECKPLAWVPDKEKDLWVTQEQEMRRECRDRARMLANMVPMPFEDWLEDMEEVERALFGEHSTYHEGSARRMAAEEDAHAHEVLQRMAIASNRGLISHQERETLRMAQQTALHTLRRSWPKCQDGTKRFDALAAEVRDGKCTLGELNGTIYRFVAVCVLRLESKGHLLVELGSWKKDHGQPLLRLPAFKQINFEGPEEALTRVMRGRFAPFASGIKLGERVVADYTGKSEAFGISTAYNKSIQYATLSDDYVPEVALPQVTHQNGKEMPAMLQKYQAFCLLAGSDNHHHHECYIHPLHTNMKMHLYTWMKVDDFDYLTTHPQGHEDLVQWLNNMTLDERAALDSLAWTCEGLNNKRSEMLKVRQSVLHDIKGQFRISKGKQEKQEQAKAEAHAAASLPIDDSSPGSLHQASLAPSGTFHHRTAIAVDASSAKAASEREVQRQEARRKAEHRRSVAAATRVLQKANSPHQPHGALGVAARPMTKLALKKVQALVQLQAAGHQAAQEQREGK